MGKLTKILEEIDVLKEQKEPKDPKLLFKLAKQYLDTAENIWDTNNKKAVSQLKKAVMQLSQLF